MSREMQIFYYAVNEVVAIEYMICMLWLLSDIVDHKKHIGRTIFVYATVHLIETIITETAAPILMKATIEMLCYVALYRLLLTKKTAVVALYVSYYWIFCIMMQEVSIVFVYKMNHDNPWIEVRPGTQLGKARVVLTSAILVFVLTMVLKQILKPILGMLDGKKTWFLVFTTYILQCICNVLRDLFFLHVDGGYLLLGLVLVVGIAAVGLILHLFFIHSLYLERKQLEEHFRMEAIEKQYVYYQEKQEEEERVRSIYHDMKNHLLVLEHQIHSPETAEMVEKLRQELESYADYVHTGNDFLNVIIKDKAQIAREKQIDFSAAIDLQGVDFLEPLDISTIFGNGLDNAIEASEKLPEDQRVIQVKAGRVQNFLSILMENNCQEESDQEENRIQNAEKVQWKGNTQNIGGIQRKGSAKKTQSMEIAQKPKRGQKKNSTSKVDDYFHGFGISNMKNAAEKYEGQLTVNCEGGGFTLKILIPIP